MVSDREISSKPPWGLAPEWPGGELEGVCDVVVIGATPAALTAAATLARGGALVAVIPLVEAIGLGGGDGGMGRLGLGFADAPDPLIASLGAVGEGLLQLGARALKYASALADAAGATRARGSLMLAAQEREAARLAGAAETLSRWGLSTTALGAEVAAKKAGFPGGGPWPSGILLEDGRGVHPLRLWAALLAEAAAAGASFGPVASAVDLSADGHGVCLTWPEGRMEAEVALVACGHRVGEVLPELGRAITPARVQCLVAEPIPLGQGALPWVANGGFEAGASLGEGRYVLSGFRYMDPNMGMSLEGPLVHPGVEGRQRAYLNGALKMAEGVELSPRILGYIGVPCDGLPLCGAVAGSPRKYVIAGLGGAELSLGLHLGALMAAGILGEAPFVPHALSPRRMI